MHSRRLQQHTYTRTQIGTHLAFSMTAISCNYPRGGRKKNLQRHREHAWVFHSYNRVPCVHTHFLPSSSFTVDPSRLFYSSCTPLLSSSPPPSAFSCSFAAVAAAAAAAAAAVASRPPRRIDHGPGYACSSLIYLNCPSTKWHVVPNDSSRYCRLSCLVIYRREIPFQGFSWRASR